MGLLWLFGLITVALIVLLVVCASFSHALNFIFEGSGADFMMLRYGNGSPFVGLLSTSPFLYYLLMATVAIAGTAMIITITIVIFKIIDKVKIAENN